MFPAAVRQTIPSAAGSGWSVSGMTKAVIDAGPKAGYQLVFSVLTALVARMKLPPPETGSHAMEGETGRKRLSSEGMDETVSDPTNGVNGRFMKFTVEGEYESKLPSTSPLPPTDNRTPEQERLEGLEASGVHVDAETDGVPQELAGSSPHICRHVGDCSLGIRRNRIIARTPPAAAFLRRLRRRTGPRHPVPSPLPEYLPAADEGR